MFMCVIFVSSSSSSWASENVGETQPWDGSAPLQQQQQELLQIQQEQQQRRRLQQNQLHQQRLQQQRLRQQQQGRGRDGSSVDSPTLLGVELSPSSPAPYVNCSPLEHQQQQQQQDGDQQQLQPSNMSSWPPSPRTASMPLPSPLRCETQAFY